MRLGAFHVIALSDGRLMLPSAELLVDDEPGVSHALLTQAHAPDRVPTSVNAFLVDTGHKRFLVDTGAGDLFGAESGKLLASLREAGYTPAQIDEVLLTHLHPDHDGGLVTHGQPTFPHAVVRLDAREAAFWLHPDNASKVGVRLQEVFKEAAEELAPYKREGRLKTFSAGATLAAGVRAVPVYGHTAGHTGYRFASRGQVLLAWGDVVHFPLVQFTDPRVTIRFDSNRSEAETTRERFLSRVAAHHTWVAGAHLVFPGIGHVRRLGEGYVWEPLAP
ncbi:MAG TPA: MBL fold metallo-hydrolase [Frateuria sp.]|uniref:MBL fold metallo-hydrolase n=1 Tax=Frateuria sp. TaxID=2211372 RepID=UPI002DF210A8|nr:MBL fold metallo-hydrolase [Frateuria sp.]